MEVLGFGEVRASSRRLLRAKKATRGSASFTAFSRTPAAWSSSPASTSSSLRLFKPANVHSACRRAWAVRPRFTILRSAGTADWSWRSNRRRCAVSRHQEFGFSRVSTSLSVVA